MIEKYSSAEHLCNASLDIRETLKTVSVNTVTVTLILNILRILSRKQLL